MNKHKVASTLGLFLAFWHLVWEVLIFLGLAQPLMNFITSMHSINNPYVVAKFNLGSAIGLIIVTYVVGYVAGTVFAIIYNKMHR